MKLTTILKTCYERDKSELHLGALSSNSGIGCFVAVQENYIRYVEQAKMKVSVFNMFTVCMNKVLLHVTYTRTHISHRILPCCVIKLPEMNITHTISSN
jgi:hypothetical protein